MRLTMTGDAGASRVTYAVRRRAGRTPMEMAQLAGNLSAAVALLRDEHRRARVHPPEAWPRSTSARLVSA